MKTLSFSAHKISRYSLFGILSILMASCGSYQSTSTSDNDGIYGSSGQNQATNSNQSNGQNNGYKEYFGSLQDNNDQQPDEIFTDVDNYSSNYDNTENPQSVTSYSSWGSNPDNVTVNVYGSN